MVVNKVGATGMVGATAVAQAPPDGYTLLVGSVNITNAVEWENANGRKPPFTRHDFAAIGAFTMSPTLVIVPADSPYKTLADFINDAKGKPGKFVLLLRRPLRDEPPADRDLCQGHRAEVSPCSLSRGEGRALPPSSGNTSSFAFQYPPTTLPLVEGKKLKVLAVAGSKRLKAIPDVPTTKELGIDAEYYGWVGIMAPKNTPAPILEKLREVTKKVAHDKAFVEPIEKPGDEVLYLDADELVKWMDQGVEAHLRRRRGTGKGSPEEVAGI